MENTQRIEIKNWDDITTAIDDVSMWGAYFGLELLKHIPIKKHIKILDIGCGTGFPTLEISQRVGDTSTIYAMDPWENGLKLLEHRIALRGINNIRILQGRAEKIGLADECLDMIISNNGISACREKKGVFKECYRVLNTGGMIIFTVLLPTSMVLLENILKKILIKNNYISEADRNNIFLQRKTYEEYQKLLMDTNFIIKDSEIKEFEIKFADGESVVNYFIFRVLFVSQWLRFVPEKYKGQIIEQLIYELDLYAKDNGDIPVNFSYAVIEAEKNSSNIGGIYANNSNG